MALRWLRPRAWTAPCPASFVPCVSVWSRAAPGSFSYLSCRPYRPCCSPLSREPGLYALSSRTSAFADTAVKAHTQHLVCRAVSLFGVQSGTDIGALSNRSSEATVASVLGLSVGMVNGGNYLSDFQLVGRPRPESEVRRTTTVGVFHNHTAAAFTKARIT